MEKLSKYLPMILAVFRRKKKEEQKYAVPHCIFDPKSTYEVFP
jgi:hypothetical protein